MSLESELQAELLLRAPLFLPTVRLFRRNVMTARIEDRTVRAGIKGQCDLYAYVRSDGAHAARIVEIELKGVDGRLRPAQQAWASWCAEWGIPHIVLKAEKGETKAQTIERWFGELQSLLSGVK